MEDGKLTILTICLLPDLHPKYRGVLPSKSLQFTSRPMGLYAASGKQKSKRCSMVIRSAKHLHNI